MNIKVKVSVNADGTFRFSRGSSRERNPRPEAGLNHSCPAPDVEAEVRRLRAGGEEVVLTGEAVRELLRCGIDADPWIDSEAP